MVTVLGASGFIGSRIVAALQAQQLPVWAPTRQDDLAAQNLGTVIYCIGLTADFRQKPFETVEAHVGKLNEILQQCTFRTLTYLSSTRVYNKIGKAVACETDTLPVNPLEPGDLYNISKLMGESLLLNSGKKTRIVRLSNVYGNDFDSDNFVSSILRDATLNKQIVLQTTLESAKDYIVIDDVVAAVLAIAERGKERIYNIASGINTTNKEIVACIQQETGCTVAFGQDPQTICFPQINIDRIVDEFKFEPSSIINALPEQIKQLQKQTLDL